MIYTQTGAIVKSIKKSNDDPNSRLVDIIAYYDDTKEFAPRGGLDYMMLRADNGIKEILDAIQ